MPGLPSGLLGAVNKTRESLGPLAQSLFDRFLPATEITPAVGMAAAPAKALGGAAKALRAPRPGGPLEQTLSNAAERQGAGQAVSPGENNLLQQYLAPILERLRGGQ